MSQPTENNNTQKFGKINKQRSWRQKLSASTDNNNTTAQGVIVTSASPPQLQAPPQLQPPPILPPFKVYKAVPNDNNCSCNFLGNNDQVRSFTVPAGVEAIDNYYFNYFDGPVIKINIKCLNIDHIISTVEYFYAKTDIDNVVREYISLLFDNLKGIIKYQYSDYSEIFYDDNYLYIELYYPINFIQKSGPDANGFVILTTDAPFTIQYTEKNC